MKTPTICFLLLAIAVAVAPLAHSQQQRTVFRVGVVHEGGEYAKAIDGLKEGLRELGLEPGKDVLLDVRAVEGDRAAAAASARSLEQAGVDLLYTLGTSVTIDVNAATKRVPIVFVGGGDPVAVGLVASLSRPGGRLTGVTYLSGDLTAKRLEILKEVLPHLRKVVTIYDPSSPNRRSIQQTREGAQALKITLVELPATSVAQLKQQFAAISSKDADAFFYAPDALVVSQLEFIVEAARGKKLPTMMASPRLVEAGALLAYGVDFHDVARLSAKYIQRILTGTSPGQLPVESFSTYRFGVNLRTARELGITIPQSVLFRADKVVE